MDTLKIDQSIIRLANDDKRHIQMCLFYNNQVAGLIINRIITVFGCLA